MKRNKIKNKKPVFNNTFIFTFRAKSAKKKKKQRANRVIFKINNKSSFLRDKTFMLRYN